MFNKFFRYHLAGAIFAAALAVRLIGLNAQGNVWDEYFYYDALRDYARAALRLDFNAASWRTNAEHPPLGKYVYAPALAWNKINRVSDKDAYRSLRFISAVVGSATVVLVFLIGDRFISRRIGLAAALIYGLMPPVVAYHKIVNLDATMVFLFTLSMYFFIAWATTDKIKLLWAAVLLAALAFAAKFNAILIALILYGTLLIMQWRSLRQTGAVKMPLPLLLYPAVAAAILVALWPWLWSDTLDHFLTTLGHWGGEVREQFWGRFGPAPPWYFAAHFLVGTPILIIALTAVGIWRQVKSKKPLAWVLILWLAAPFAISFYHLRQDHLRYILAAYPAAALIASIGFWRLTNLLRRRFHLMPAFSFFLLTFYLLAVVWRIHPYYLNYYNVLVGGPAYVARKNLFVLGFYGEGIKEATEFVNRTAAAGATVHYEVIPDDAPYLDRPRLSRLDRSDADYLIFNGNGKNHPQKQKAIDTAGYELAYTVRAGGAPFVWVYQKSEK